jgi:hypothetical protein
VLPAVQLVMAGGVSYIQLADHKVNKSDEFLSEQTGKAKNERNPVAVRHQ